MDCYCSLHLLLTFESVTKHYFRLRIITLYDTLHHIKITLLLIPYQKCNKHI